MKTNWFKELFSSKHQQTPYPQMLKEAKEQDFYFRLYSVKRGEEIIVSSDDVDVQGEQIILTTTEKSFAVSYKDLLEVQILSKSKTANLIGRKPISNIYYGLLIPAVGFFILFFYKTIANWISATEDTVSGFATGTIFMGYIIYLYMIVTFYAEQDKIRIQAVSTGRITTIIKQLKKANREEEYFSALLLDNLKNIQDFNSLVKQQTHNSYRVTVIAALAGFVVLLVGILGPDLVSNPNLTITSGLIIEFISAVFFILHNGKITQLNKYHRELIEVQNTMLALKISQEITNDQVMKNKSMEYLIKKLASNLDKKSTENDLPPDVSRKPKNEDVEKTNQTN